MPQTKYKLPPDLRMRCISFVRGYDRMLEAYHAARDDVIFSSSAPADGVPRGNVTGDVVFDKAGRLAEIDRTFDAQVIKAIDQAQHEACLYIESDEERRKLIAALMESCSQGRRFYFEYCALAMSRSSFYRLRQKFLYDIAKNMGFI